MRMALYTIDRDSVQYGPGSCHTIHNGNHAKFLVVGPAFFVIGRLSMKGRSDAVFKRSVRK